MWHERWWLGAGGELAVPLLDEEGEEQQHAVGVLRGHHGGFDLAAYTRICVCVWRERVLGVRSSFGRHVLVTIGNASK